MATTPCTVHAVGDSPHATVASLHGVIASPHAVVASLYAVVANPAGGYSPLSWSLLADPGKVRGCFTNTVLIHLVSQSFSQSVTPFKIFCYSDNMLKFKKEIPDIIWFLYSYYCFKIYDDIKR